MATIRFYAALVLAGCLGLAPSLLKAANIGRIGGQAGAAPGASLGAAGAALKAPLANLMTYRIVGKDVPVRDWAVGQVAAALAQRPDLKAQNLAAMETPQALAVVDEAVRDMVRETAGKIAAEKDAAANYDRAIDLMKFRAALFLSLDDETLKTLDEAYQAAQDQFSSSTKGEVLAQFRRMAETLQSSDFVGETGLLHLGERTLDKPAVAPDVNADLSAFSSLPGAGERSAADLERRNPRIYLKESVRRQFQPKAFKMPAPAAFQAPKLPPGGMPALLRRGLEGQHDRLAGLKAQLKRLIRAGSRPRPTTEYEQYLQWERVDIPLAIQEKEAEIQAVQTEIGALEGPLRAKLAENRARLSELKTMRRGFEEIQSRAASPGTGVAFFDHLPAAPAPTALEASLRAEGVDLGGQIQSLNEQIAALEKENADLKASLPPSRLLRVLTKTGRFLLHPAVPAALFGILAALTIAGALSMGQVLVLALLVSLLSGFQGYHRVQEIERQLKLSETEENATSVPRSRLRRLWDAGRYFIK